MLDSQLTGRAHNEVKQNEAMFNDEAGVLSRSYWQKERAVVVSPPEVLSAKSKRKRRELFTLVIPCWASSQ